MRSVTVPRATLPVNSFPVAPCIQSLRTFKDVKGCDEAKEELREVGGAGTARMTCLFKRCGSGNSMRICLCVTAVAVTVGSGRGGRAGIQVVLQVGVLTEQGDTC